MMVSNPQQNQWGSYTICMINPSVFPIIPISQKSFLIKTPYRSFYVILCFSQGPTHIPRKSPATIPSPEILPNVPFPIRSPTKSAPRCTEWSYIPLRPRPRRSPGRWCRDSADELADTPGDAQSSLRARVYSVSSKGEDQRFSNELEHHIHIYLSYPWQMMKVPLSKATLYVGG